MSSTSGITFTPGGGRGEGGGGVGVICVSSFTAGSGWSSRRSKPVKSEKDVVDLGAKFGVAVGSDSDSSDAEFAPEHEERDSADSVSDDGGGSSSGEEGGDEEEEEGEGEEGESQERESERGGEEEGKTGERAETGGGVKEKEEVKTDADTEKGEEEDGKEKREEEGEEKREEEGEEEGATKDVSQEGGDKDDSVEYMESEASVEKETASTNIGEPVPGAGDEDQRIDNKKNDEYNPLIVRRSNRAIKPTKDVDLYLLGAKFGIDVEGSGAESSDMEFAPAENSPGTCTHACTEQIPFSRKLSRVK